MKMKRKSVDVSILFIIVFASLFGGFFRFRPVLLSNFPLNDGGLFYQMTQDILAHHFTLPGFTTYNGSEIPFAYPPLAFYLMAIIQQVIHIRVIDQLRFLPALFSTLSIPAFYYLSRSITDSKERSAFAVIAFAFMPASFIWMIMGGGITRSLALFLGILALFCLRELFKTPRVYLLLLSILLFSLTVLSHPGTAWFIFISSALFFFSFGRNKKGAIYAAIIVAGILVLTSPWWITIIHNYGISTILNGASTGGIFSLSIFISYFTQEPYVTILAVLSIFGIFAELIRRRYFLFIWMVLIMLLSPRSGDAFATIPGSMLVGSGIVWLLIPGLFSNARRLIDENLSLEQIFNERISKITFAYILVIALWGPMAVAGLPETSAVSQDDQIAMQRISQNTSMNDSFIVLTGVKDWYMDNISEWFPALSGRISISTIQGSEWLPKKENNNYNERYTDLQSCTDQDYSCITTWAEQYEASYSYIYLNKPMEDKAIINLPISYSLASSKQLQLVFDNPRASVFRVIKNP
jgi:hypothetical protein